MATGAAERLLQCVFEGCLAASDMDIERRPYHRNCGCALHKSGESCSKGSPRIKKISYRIRRSWSESCLALGASIYSSLSSSPANSMLAVERVGELCKEHESVSWET